MNEILNLELPELYKLQHILDDLTYRFMDIREYRSAINAGQLIKKKIFEDDMIFQAKYPDHPYTLDNRYVRINASDKILKIALTLKRQFPDPVLEQLHVALFDCCATVRLSLSQALELTGGQSSILYLTQLNELEDESKLVKDQSAKSIMTLKMKYKLV